MWECQTKGANGELLGRRLVEYLERGKGEAVRRREQLPEKRVKRRVRALIPDHSSPEYRRRESGDGEVKEIKGKKTRS